MTAVLLVACVVLYVSAMNAARHEPCHTVFLSLYFRDFQSPASLFPYSAISLQGWITCLT